MYLKRLEIAGFKSFAKKSEFEFSTPITSIVGPNGSGKSNVAEAFRFVLGEQSIKSMRGKKGEDLIFNGAGARANRAGVKVVFDNSNRLLDVDFDEVAIERAVYRDGTNEYLINGSKVRLKDVVELLAGANIGASGHHIISQGEADRVLSATPKERRGMIEDALGLRVFQYKKTESDKKLKKTEENKVQIESLRKENAPHLRFLERQVNKIKKSLELREKLSSVYKEYLLREERYLDDETRTLRGLKEGPEQELAEVNDTIKSLRAALEAAEENDTRRTEVLEIEQELSKARSEVGGLTREVGSIEGQIAFANRKIEEEERRRKSGDIQHVQFHDVKVLTDDIEEKITEVETVEDPVRLWATLDTVRTLSRDFIAHQRALVPQLPEADRSDLDALEQEKRELEAKIQRVQTTVEEYERKYKSIQDEMNREKDENRSQEREMFELMQKQNDIRSMLGTLTAREDRLTRDKEEFKRELAEAGALMGREVTKYKDYATENPEFGKTLAEQGPEDREVQLDRRRELERMKIRLEELGGADADEVMKEYEEVKERDAFLERELADLEQSAESLRQLIADLEAELEQKFQEGITQISKAFGNYFSLMFGGGKAGLDVIREKKKKKGVMDLLGFSGEEEVPEEEEDEEEQGDMGIEVNVSLPNKKVKGLMMLSGGERALTSIALIFAMSQINPPPFLILDETDAALDEANSRRYGDMVENLAERSQLIVITHNRETMSRAGILYGVTMGGDGVSKVLSVKFDEAIVVAK